MDHMECVRHYEQVASVDFARGVAGSGLSGAQIGKYFDFLAEYCRAIGRDKCVGLPVGGFARLCGESEYEAGVCLGGGIRHDDRGIPVVGVGELVEEFANAAGGGGDTDGFDREEARVASELGLNGKEKGVFPAMKKGKRGKNQRDREKWAASGDWRKPTVVVADVSGGEVAKTKARETLEKKWEVENRVAIAKAELAEEKAKKDLEFQRARDVEAEIKRNRTLVMKQTEANKVATEKAFATLRATGNVPGFCETVVSGEGGSVPGLSNGETSDCMISPDSSASMHEFREAQKKIADQEYQIKRLTRQLALGKLNAGEEAAFTIHSDGEVSDDVKEAISKCKNDFFDVDTNDDGYEDERPHTLFAKRVPIPSADDYLYENF